LHAVRVPPDLTARKRRAMSDENRPRPVDFSVTVAEAAAAGYSHVYAECCSLTAVPFRLIRGLRPHTTLGQIAAKLRCQRCGKPPKEGTVAFWSLPTERGR